MSIFTNKNETKMVDVKFKIPQSIKVRMDDLKSELENINPDLQFNEDQIVADELDKMIKKGEAEVKKMKDLSEKDDHNN